MNRLIYLILLAKICLFLASTDYEILCDFASATNILDHISGWNCNGYADICVNGVSAWEGIDCSSSSLVERISLTSYSITGTISSNLGLMTNLNSLTLNNNRIYGEIPSSLGLLQNLIELDLSFNSLSKTIPPAVTSISKLKSLKIFTNCLTGSIPTEIGLSKSLTIFDASNNKLSKSIPSTLGGASSLVILNLGPNHLTSTIPTSLGLLDSITNIQLDGNSLYGNVPEQLCNTALESLTLYAYDFTLERYNANYLWCYAKCLSQVDTRYFGPISNCTTNSTTSIPVPLDFNILCDVVAATDISIRTNHTWNCTKGVPTSNVCLWIGVTCDSSTHILQLDISHLKVKGTLPSTLGKLDSLSVLDLSHNSLFGNIPKQLGNCSKLKDLDISYNQFTSTIPTTLCHDILKNITVDRDLTSSNTAVTCYDNCLTTRSGFVGGVLPTCSYSPTTAPQGLSWSPSAIPVASPTRSNSSENKGIKDSGVKENKNEICLNIKLTDTFGDGWEGGQLLLYSTATTKEQLYSIPCGQRTYEVVACIPIANKSPVTALDVTDKKDKVVQTMKMQKRSTKLCLQFLSLTTLLYPNEIFWTVTPLNNPTVMYTGNHLTTMSFIINDVNYGTPELTLKFYKNPPSDKTNCATCSESSSSIKSNKYDDNMVTIHYPQNNNNNFSPTSTLNDDSTYHSLQLSVLEVDNNNNNKYQNYKSNIQQFNLCNNDNNKQCVIRPVFSNNIIYAIRVTSSHGSEDNSNYNDSTSTSNDMTSTSFDYCQETFSTDTEIAIITTSSTSTIAKTPKKNSKYSSSSSSSKDSFAGCEIIAVHTLSNICNGNSNSNSINDNKKSKPSTLFAKILITTTTTPTTTSDDLKPLLTDALAAHFSLINSLVSYETSTSTDDTAASILSDSIIIKKLSSSSSTTTSTNTNTNTNGGSSNHLLTDLSASIVLTNSKQSASDHIESSLSTITPTDNNNKEGSQLTVSFEYPLPHPDISLSSLEGFLQSSITSGLLQLRIQHHAEKYQQTSLSDIESIELLNINIIHKIAINKSESILGSIAVLFLSVFALSAIIFTVSFIKNLTTPAVLTNNTNFTYGQLNTTTSGAEMEGSSVDKYPGCTELRSSAGSTIHNELPKRENVHQVTV